MTIQIIKGNLLDASEKVIAHGCNTRGVMGAGIAGQISKRWPKVQTMNRLGLALGGFLPGSIQPIKLTDGRAYLPTDPEYVVNMATQVDPGPFARLHLIAMAFGNLAEWAAMNEINRIAIPQIGCGIGGLQWLDVENAIQLAVQDIYDRGHPLQIVCYVLP